MENNSVFCSSPGAFASIGISYLRWFDVVFLLVSYCSALISLEWFRKLSHQVDYIQFMPDFCVCMLSEKSLVHKKSRVNIFSLNMYKFATI